MNTKCNNEAFGEISVKRKKKKIFLYIYIYIYIYTHKKDIFIY